MRPVSIAALAVGLFTSCANAQLLNGSFESVALTEPGRVSITNATSWTANLGQTLHERGVNGVSQIAAQDGLQFVTMGHNGATGDTLYQIIPTTPGVVFEVSFYVACVQGDTFQRIVGSAIDTSTDTTLSFVNADVSSRTQGWLLYSFEFLATGGTTRINFEHSIAAIDANIALDNVAVIPAPSAAGLLALAGVVFGSRRRSR